MDAKIMSAYSERERLSMALWDALCDMLPATADERAYSKNLDEQARRDNGISPTKQRTPEQIAHQRELAKRWRATHKEYIKAKKSSAEYRDAESGRKAAARVSA